MLSSRVCWGDTLNYEEARYIIFNEIERGNRLAVMNKNLFDNEKAGNNSNINSNKNNGINFNNSNDTNNSCNNDIRKGIIKNNDDRNKNTNSYDNIRLNYNPSQPIAFHGWTEESCDRLRAVLESILSINPSHPVLWILYVHLECSFLRFLEGKKILFRSINAVGFCKNIWNLMYGILRPAFTLKEINDLKNVMIEEKNILFRG